MARPTLYPKQLVCQISDDLADRVERDAGQRQDKSKSAAARRLLELGVLLADALERGGIEGASEYAGTDALETAARAVR